MSTNLVVQSRLSQKLQWTPHAAPHILGLVSAQTSTSDPNIPDIAVYRNEAEEAEQWIEEMAKNSEYDAFFLRRNEQVVDLYDSKGNHSKRLPRPTYPSARESEDVLKLDRDVMRGQVRKVLRTQGLSLLACHEEHAGANAADHSNYIILCRRMIMEASRKDIEQFYICEHKSWPCRVSCVYADVSALSPDMQNIYVERHKWVSRSWPLNTKHHFDTLADHFSRVRNGYVTDLLMDCGHAAGMSGEMILTMQSKWMLASPGVRYRFSQHLVDKLKDGLIYTPAEAEVFDPSYVEVHGAAAVSDYRSLLN